PRAPAARADAAPGPARPRAGGFGAPPRPGRPPRPRPPPARGGGRPAHAEGPAVTAAGLHRPAPGSPPGGGPARPAATLRHRAAAGWHLTRLYLVSRRVPMALALLAGLGVLLWAALRWRWNIAGGAAAKQFIPLTIETGAAALIAVTTYGPFGEPERAAGRWLPVLRLGAAVALTGVAFGLLAAGAAAAHTADGGAAAGVLPGGTIALLRNLGGLTGLGLPSAVPLRRPLR